MSNMSHVIFNPTWSNFVATYMVVLAYHLMWLGGDPDARKL